MRKALYTHDCKGCQFLGSFLGNDGGFIKEFDLYYCQQEYSASGGTVIARFGSQENEYLISSVPLAQSISHMYIEENPLYEAVRRAKAQRLLYPNSIRLILDL